MIDGPPPAEGGSVTRPEGKRRSPLTRPEGKRRSPGTRLSEGLFGRSETPAWQAHVGHQHRDLTGGTARAAVFGMSDGLVSNVSLILGVAGASSGGAAVVVAGVAGLIAGAVSMAAGEYASMQAQRELVERELAIEERALQRNPEAETRELAMLYRERGLDAETARSVAEQFMRDPGMALEVHAKEELGIDPDSLGSPIGAAVSSFGAFSIGALIPLLPWLVGEGAVAVVVSLALAMASAGGIGFVLARLSGRPPLRSVVRQVLLTAFACVVTFGIGSLVGTAVG